MASFAVIRALNVARSISSPDLRRVLVCKSRSRGAQERGEVQMRCRGRARVTAGPCGPGTAPKMGVPGGASIDSRGGCHKLDMHISDRSLGYGAVPG